MKILVQFDCQIGDYSHSAYDIFKDKKSEWEYCKEFWGITKKNILEDNVFWDDAGMNAINVYSETEITDEEAATLIKLGVVYE